MQPADGLKVSLFAAEPDLRNPTSMDVDARGRVWIAEAVNYRLFNQDMADEMGDRIRVLEDSDGDGRCDKATTFYQDPSLQAPMGIAVLGDRVYVCQSPDLFYLRDTDGDGVADEKTVILTGFGGVDNDHAIHGVMFGPDGYLYISVGDQGLDVTDSQGTRIWAGKKGQPYRAATLLRTDLDGRRIEVLADGMRNPYEPAVDTFGTVFISDNDDDGNEQCRINYIMEGGHYGYYPRPKGDRRLDSVHWNEDQPGVVPKMVKTGFGSPTGILFYQGDLLPERWRNTLIHADAGPGVIRSYPIITDGAGYRSEIDTLLSCKEDSWFRPSDVSAAPDGSLLIADWYDPGVGGHRMADTARGRVYRLAPDPSSYRIEPLDLDTDEGLARALTSPNQARRFLAFQAVENRVREEGPGILHEFVARDDIALRAQALWLLARTERDADPLLLEATRDASPDIRTQAVRMLASKGPDRLREAPWLLDDPNPAVRRQLLVEIARMNDNGWADPWLLKLAKQYDGSDRFYREALGIALNGKEEWAFGELVKKTPAAWDGRITGLAIQLHPAAALEGAQTLAADPSASMHLRKLALKALDAIRTTESGEIIVELASNDASSELRRYALRLLARDEGDTWRKVTMNADFSQTLIDALAEAAMSDAAWDYIAETRQASFIPYMTVIAAESTQNVDTRIRAAETIRRLAPRAVSGREDDNIVLLGQIFAEDDPRLCLAAMRAVAAFRGERSDGVLRSAVLDLDLPQSFRRETVRHLGRSRTGEVLLLALAESNDIPGDLILDVTESVHDSRYENLRLMAQQLLPREPNRLGEALPPFNELLNMTGDPARGRELFFSQDYAQCARCHAVNGQGAQVGPDLSKIGEKLGRRGILESILNPSAAIAPEYQVWILQSKRHGYLNGYIRSETDTYIELMEATANPIRIQKDDLQDRRLSTLSLMPTGLPAGLSTSELVDLVAYLEDLR